MTDIRIYSTLTRQKETFVPVQPGKVGIYLCGPTVYKEAHVGHLVGPIIFDAIKRYLTHAGFEVTWIVNITDVDDKLIAESHRRRIPMGQVATEMTMDYCANLLEVGVDQISAMPRATEHMADIVRLIESLIQKGFAYAVDGDVFFDVLSDPNYGKLSNRSAESQQGEGGEAAGKKRSAGDFALWKRAKPGEPAWPSPWGDGRPGWHIECSAMSYRLLGETFDIHGGGLDLMFPHHENEIAQSECCHGKPMAKYWLHNGLLRAGEAGKIGGRTDRTAESTDSSPSTPVSAESAAGKMSRSKGAGGLRGLLQRQGGEKIRFFLLRTHYRSTVIFSEEAIAEEGKALDRFYQFFERYRRITQRTFYLHADDDRVLVVRGAEAPSGEGLPSGVAELREAFLQKMADDFNTGAAMAELFQLLSLLNKYVDTHQLESATCDADAKLAFCRATEVLRELGAILGLFLKPPTTAPQTGDQQRTDKLMELIVRLRADARSKKDFATADVIRQSLTAAGVAVEDRKDGTTWTFE